MPTSFEQYVHDNARELLRYATALTCDPHTAQDVVQSVLLRAGQRWPGIERLAMPGAYVHRMVTNEFLSWRRRAVRTVSVPHEVIESVAPPSSDETDRVDQRHLMFQGIALLPRKQRAAVVLRYYANRSFAEIAGELGCSEATARSHISRGLAALRDRIPALERAKEAL
ncbi:SigE family RNA polymerase sigma factor [Actinokineospora terrae]|uniref:RNA polymerase sigma-70 factor, sigma-E family n=1 Tax=Actinokineospora terrae TaxID=155974 RepID=A0A1H9SJE2_9PSEU|nr:SigE family RNA polymerase sigma factor [Actinokineospora terrae]SER85156.1 RNA polymerase sigma-70 factor, sigma-E family [Actinokineospora terrae]